MNILRRPLFPKKGRGSCLLLVLTGCIATYTICTNWSLPTRTRIDTQGLPVHEPNTSHIILDGYIDSLNGVAPLSPLRVGRVTEVLVRENDKVSKGQSLVKMYANAEEEKVKLAELALEISKLRQRQTAKSSERTQLQINSASARLQASKARLESFEFTLRSKRELKDLKMVGASELQAAESQLKEYRALVNAEIANLQILQQPESDNATLAQLEVEEAILQVDIAKSLLVQSEIVAPSDGMILRVEAVEGEVISPTKPTLYFASSQELVARASIEQSLASEIHVGDLATIEKFPRSIAKWQGRVERLSNWFTQMRSKFGSEPLTDVVSIEVVIAIEDSGQFKIGERVQIGLHHKNK